MNPQQPGGQWPAPVPPQDQQQPALPPVQNQLPTEQYDFILNPNTAPQKKPLVFSGGGKLKRIALLGSVLVVLLILGSAFASYLSRPKISAVELTAVAQNQNELIRIAAIGTKNARTSTALNSAYTVQLSVTSAQQQLLQYMGKNNVNVSPAVLGLKKNAQTDARLNSALSSGVFDSTFNDIMQTQLAAYQKSLAAASRAGLGPTGKQLINQQAESATLLLLQSRQK